MIGLDTNVIVRYLAQDDAKQAAIASRLFEHELSVERPGFVTLIALCETVWVLADCYGVGKTQLSSIIEGLLTSRQLLVEKTELAWRALRTWRESPADFSDALMGEVILENGCEKAVTFDKAAARLARFVLLGN